MKVIELEPKNKQAKEELERTRLREAKAKEKKDMGTLKENKDQVKVNKEKDGGGSFGENIKAAFSKRTKAGPANSKPVQELQPGQGGYSTLS